MAFPLASFPHPSPMRLLRLFLAVLGLALLGHALPGRSVSGATAQTQTARPGGDAASAVSADLPAAHVDVVVAPDIPQADSVAASFRQELEALAAGRVQLNLHRRAPGAPPSSSASALTVHIGTAEASSGRSAAVKASLRPRPDSSARPDALLAPSLQLTDDLRRMQDVVSVKNVALLVDRSPSSSFRRAVRRAERAGGLRIQTVAVPDGAAPADVRDRIPDAAGAVYVLAPTPVGPARHRLFENLAEQRIAVASFYPGDLSGGALMTLRAPLADPLGRQIALRVLDRLLDAPAPSLPPVGSASPSARPALPPPELRLNRATAQQLERPLPWQVRLDAVRVRAPADSASFSLEEAVRRSVQENLQVRSASYTTEARADAVASARSRLLPQVSLQSTGTLVDESTAQASFGAQPQRSVRGSIRAQQVLYDPDAWAGVDIAQDRLRAQTAREQGTSLDVAAAAADGYLAVLQADVLIRIQKENLSFARTNLRLARSREAVGRAGPAEVARTRSRAAQSRRRAIDAHGRREQARLTLNQTLNRPLDASLPTAEPPEPDSLVRAVPVVRYLDDRGARKRLRSFLLQEAVEASPAVRAAEAQLDARERQLDAATRSFFLPTVALQGQYANRVLEDGAGTGGIQTPPTFPLDIPAPSDQQWNVGLSVSLPLFEGSARAAERSQASARLRQARTQRRRTVRRVEQTVRSAFVGLESAYASVEEARTAAEAARRALATVRDAYRRGEANLVDLLDAQTTSRVTDEEYARAAITLLRRWVDLQRATNRFDALAPPSRRADYYDRLRRYVQRPGAPSTEN